MVQIQSIPANRSNYGDKRSLGNIKYIVIHYTANDGDTAKGNGNYFKNNIVKASAHYFVDDDTIVRSVPDDYAAWSVGGSKYPDCGRTGGGNWYGKCTNSNSISVELCDTVKNGVSDFSESTVRNAVELVRSLMGQYGIDTEHVIRHFDVTGKICPKPYIDGAAWQGFKNMIEEDEAMTAEERQEFEAMKNELEYYKSVIDILGNRITKLMKNELEYYKSVIDILGDRITKLENPMIYNYIDKNMPEWARPTIQKLVGKGILVGNGNGELGLTDNDLKQFVANDRAGIYG